MKSNFHKRIFISISIFIAGITLACVTFLSMYTYRSLERQSNQNLAQLCESTATEFDSLIDEMNKLALYASTSRIVMDVFMDRNSPDASGIAVNQDIFTVLNSLSTPNSSNRFRISLYSGNGTFFSTGIPYSQQYVTDKLTDASYRSWYDTLPVKDNSYSLEAFHEDYWTGTGEKYLSLYRQIFDPYLITSSNGIAEIQCPYDTVRELFQFQDSQYQALLLDTQGRIILSSADDTGPFQSFEENENILSGSPRQGVLDGLIYSTCALNDGYYIVITQSQTHIWDVILPQIAVIILMGIVTLFLILAVVFTITRRSTEPLRKLTSEIRLVSAATPTLHLDNIDYPDEVYSLNQAFSQMFDRIRAFTDEIVAVRTSEMRAHMIALQAQMNPHFLYNMMAVIKAMSQEGSNAQIEAACDYLVRILRYTSSYEKSDVTLEDELDYASCYLALMKMRYEDCFEYKLALPEGAITGKLILPRLTLLPLLENSFKHGFHATAPPWRIAIRCEKTPAAYRITVTDNGCGIPADKQKKIKENLDALLKNPDRKISELTFGGMGFVNTLARLTLKYKEKFHFEILSPTEGGTSIILEVKES